MSDHQPPTTDFDLADTLDGLPPLVTREETAELLRVSLSTVDRWRASGQLGSHKVGRRVYITRRSLFALLGAILLCVVVCATVRWCWCPLTCAVDRVAAHVERVV